MRSLNLEKCTSWLHKYALIVALLCAPAIVLGAPTQRIQGNLSISGSTIMGAEDGSPVAGMVAYDPGNNELAVYNGTAWQRVFDAANLTGTLPPGLLHCSDLVDAKPSCSTDTTNASNITSGTLPAARLPAPTATTLGGVESLSVVSHNFLTGISTAGAPTQAQPAFGDISGNISVSQMNSGTGASSSTFWRGDGTWQTVTNGFSNPMTTLGDLIYEDATPTAVRLAGNTTTTKKYLSQTGNGTISAAPSWAQIAFGDLSGSVASTQMPALTGDVTTTAGTVATTVGKIQGVAVANTAPTTNQVLQYNGTSWTPATAQSSGINWITTGDAETNSTAGWIMYNDSSATPVDCTGGTVVGTPLTVTSTSPLSGTYSYVWTHGAANSQGIGFSYAFTTDTGNATKVESTQFDIKVTSGTWAAGVPAGSGSTGSDSDQTVWIYDVDSSTLIQPTTYRIYGGNGGSFHFQTYWQPVNSSSRNYRLCIHNATTTASAYTTEFDSVSTAPATYTYGTPITDWQSTTLVAGTNLTATTTNPAFGTVANNAYRWRRVGSNLEFIVDYRQTSAGATAGTGSFLITLPNSAQVDTTLVTTNGGTTTNGYGTILGDAWLSNAATGIASQAHIGQVIAWDASHITARFKINASTADTWTSLLWGSSLGASQFNNANLTFHFSGSVPIQGWSSSVQMSDSAPQTLVALDVGAAIGTGTLTANTETVVPLGSNSPSITIDTVGGWSSANNQYTVQTPGIYRITPTCALTGTWAVSDYLISGIQLNGSSSTYLGAMKAQAAVTTQLMAQGSGIAQYKAGDTLKLVCKTNASSKTYDNSLVAQGFKVERLSSLQTIGATETVAAFYTTTNANTITTGNSAVIANLTKVYDTHGGMNASTGVYTVPYSGKYRISSGLTMASIAFTAGAGRLAVMRLTGTQTYLLNIWTVQSTVTTQPALNGSVTQNFNAGDTISITEANSTGSTTNLDAVAAENWISIERVGN
jgi:hypothetical protein